MNGLEKDIWPIIFKELSDKKISYAVCKNTYPQNQNWSEHKSLSLPIMLEDPDRPPLPEYEAPWYCFLNLKLECGMLTIGIDLDINLPVTVDIQEVLKIIDHPYIGDHPSLILIDLPSAGKQYCINIKGSYSTNSSVTLSGVDLWLQTRINAINEIVKILYMIEKKPDNKNLIDDLVEYLVEI